VIIYTLPHETQKQSQKKQLYENSQICKDKMKLALIRYIYLKNIYTIDQCKNEKQTERRAIN